MKKFGAEKEAGNLEGARHLIAALFLFSCLLSTRPAMAQCELPGDGTSAVTELQTLDIERLNLFIKQEGSYSWNIMSTAFEDLAQAYLTFSKNVLQALNTFAAELNVSGMGESTKAMTMELHVSQVDQTYRLGQMQDAQIMTEEEGRKENLIDDSQKRYMPSDLACMIDTAGPGLSKAYQISRALNRTLAMDDEPRRENAWGSWPVIDSSGKWTLQHTTSYNGAGQDVNALWQTYTTKYCDNTMGDQGCTTPGVDAGFHKDIGALLWGSQLTIDPTNPEKIREIQDTLRFIIDPLAPDPIPQTVIPQPGENVAQASQGREAVLERHAEMAYVNTIYNTLGAMLSERVGGSGVDVSVMRQAAGIPQAATTSGTVPNVGASYREVQEAMTRDRFDDPKYIVKMLANPEQVARERTLMSALRLQTMNDIYRRQEELLFMEAAEYGRDLNAEIPRAETGNIPLK
jgi:hypothetical protein